jgi:hypothetical protein
MRSAGYGQFNRRWPQRRLQNNSLKIVPPELAISSDGPRNNEESPRYSVTLKQWRSLTEIDRVTIIKGDRSGATSAVEQSARRLYLGELNANTSAVLFSVQ